MQSLEKKYYVGMKIKFKTSFGYKYLTNVPCWFSSVNVFMGAKPIVIQIPIVIGNFCIAFGPNFEGNCLRGGSLSAPPPSRGRKPPCNDEMLRFRHTEQVYSLGAYNLATFESEIKKS